MERHDYSSRNPWWASSSYIGRFRTGSRTGHSLQCFDRHSWNSHEDESNRLGKTFVLSLVVELDTWPWGEEKHVKRESVDIFPAAKYTKASKRSRKIRTETSIFSEHCSYCLATCEDHFDLFISNLLLIEFADNVFYHVFNITRFNERRGKECNGVFTVYWMRCCKCGLRETESSSASSFDNSQVLKLLENMEILNSNMVLVSVGMRQWEYQSEDEDESVVLLVGVDSTEDEYKSVQNRQSWSSEWCDVKNHGGNTLCLPRTYEKRNIAQ